MPQAANIAIADGASTPVIHTFVPSKVSDLASTFYGPGSSLSGREQLIITRREPTATVAGKVSMKLVLPTEAVVDSQTIVSYQDLVSVDFVFSPKGLKADRKDARVLLKNLLDNATIAAVIDDFDGIF